MCILGLFECIKSGEANVSGEIRVLGYVQDEELADRTMNHVKKTTWEQN